MDTLIMFIKNKREEQWFNPSKTSTGYLLTIDETDFNKISKKAGFSYPSLRFSKLTCLQINNERTNGIRTFKYMGSNKSNNYSQDHWLSNVKGQSIFLFVKRI